MDDKNKAKAIEVEEVSGDIDKYVARRIGHLILENPVSSRAYQQIQKGGVRIKLSFGNPPNESTRGITDSYNRIVTIYVKNTVTTERTIQTIVHESRHIKRADKGKGKNIGTQYEEFLAFCREFLYTYNRRPTKSEREEIWGRIKEIYADIPER